mgnify:CR=1 FL=1
MDTSQNDTPEVTAEPVTVDAPTGYHWESEAVSLRYGDNDSDKKVVNSAAQILVIDNIEAWRKAFGDEFLLATANGTSPRVICQGIGRLERFHGGKRIEENRAAVLNRIRGIRNKGGTVVKHNLPDGTFYHGADETEYRQKYAAGLVDAGVDGGIALAIAGRMAW